MTISRATPSTGESSNSVSFSKDQLSTFVGQIVRESLESAFKAFKAIQEQETSLPPTEGPVSFEKNTDCLGGRSSVVVLCFSQQLIVSIVRDESKRFR